MQEFNGMKIGDYITTYHKGIHKLDKIEDQGYNHYIFHYTRVLDSDFEPSRKYRSKCSSYHCRLAPRELEDQLKKLHIALDMLATKDD